MHSSFSSDNSPTPDRDSQKEPSDAVSAREVRTLNRLRWQISQAALVILSLVTALHYLFSLLIPEVAIYSLPVLIALLASSVWFAFLAMAQGMVQRVSPRVERTGYLGALVLFLGFYTRTVGGIFWGNLSPGEMGTAFPWLAVVCAAAFVVYRSRTALALSCSVVLYTAGLNAYFIVQRLLRGEEVILLGAALNLFAASTVLLLMLFVLRRTTEAWSRTQAQADALTKLANRDALTGLYNRRYLNTALQEEVRRAERYAHPLSIALCDIDDFKGVNDLFSHGVGDEVLQQVARILEGSVRSVDSVARYGGEEFVFIFPETDAAQAETVCEKIRLEIERYPWSQLHPDLNVTVSIGVSSAQESPERLLSAADLKLYEGKRSGKNQVRL